MTKILTPGAVCVIPDTLGGMSVTELADRAAAGLTIREIYLPRTLKKIGRYGFYNCEQLQIIHFYAETKEVGGGIFNGCKNISELHICMNEDERSALRDFVTEIAERITVHYIMMNADGEEQEKARLVFPEYYDEAIENTPARNLSFEIHGSGQKYRYCFGDRKLQFDRYDKMFSKEVIEESTEAAAEIAANRLTFPYALTLDAKRKYEEFLKEHLYEVLAENMCRADIFKWLTAEFVSKSADEMKDVPLTLDEFDRLIHKSSLHRLPEISGLLMDLKQKYYPPMRKKFEF